jgi:HEAT repeat protein
LLRLRAVSIFRKISDKRALPVLIEVLLYDNEKYYHRGELHEMYVTSIFINSAMALHSLTGGQIGIKPSEHDYVEMGVGAEIERNRDEILKKCKEWWKDNKKRVLKEIEEEDKQSRIEKAFELYKKGETAQLLKQSHEVRIAVLKKALQAESLKGRAIRLVSYCRFDVKELAPEVITVAKESSGYLRWQTVEVLTKKIPDKRAVPVLIEHCLEDNYEDVHHWVDEHGGHEAVRSTLYETARALHAITKGEIGVKRPLHTYMTPSAVVLGLKKRLPQKIKQWWAENKDEFLKELEKEYGTTEIGTPKKEPEKKKPKKQNP